MEALTLTALMPPKALKRRIRMTSENITSIIVAFIAALGGAGGQKIFDWWKIKKEERRKADMATGLTDVMQVFEAMTAVITKTSAERFVIFRGSNGGSTPRPGHEFYASAVHEKHDNHDAPRLVEKYRRVAVDASYIAMLLEVIANGKKLIEVQTMEPGLLKNIYTAEGITYCEVYYIAKTEKEVYYCSIATTKENEKFTREAERVEIDLAVSTIRDVFKQHL